jgi:small subunit ribosomal protein S17
MANITEFSQDTDARAPSATPAQRGQRRTLVGLVTSDKMDKTRRVEVPRIVKHTRYGKFIRRRTVCHVHDEMNETRHGDTVEIMETRPISKTKRWRVVRILTKAPESDAMRTEDEEVIYLRELTDLDGERARLLSRTSCNDRLRSAAAGLLSFLRRFHDFHRIFEPKSDIPAKVWYGVVGPPALADSRVNSLLQQWLVGRGDVQDKLTDQLTIYVSRLPESTLRGLATAGPLAQPTSLEAKESEHRARDSMMQKFILSAWLAGPSSGFISSENRIMHTLRVCIAPTEVRHKIREVQEAVSQVEFPGFFHADSVQVVTRCRGAKVAPLYALLKWPADGDDLREFTIIPDYGDFYVRVDLLANTQLVASLDIVPTSLRS